MTEDRNPKSAEESTAAASATKQRKKRKWDQPAESLISAGVSAIGALPLSMGGLAGIPFPGVIALSSALMTNPVPVNSATASVLFQSPSISQAAAAIAQKLNQPKIQDELIAREIVINDAEPTVRYRLTKRQTQEEIQKSTGAVVITRGKYRPPNGLPDGEKPLYLHISAGAHLKDTAERIKAVDWAASMVEEILKQGQNSQSVSTLFTSVSTGQATQPPSISLFLGFETDPSLNIAARIRGPNDQYINHIMNETGATVVLRGRGSGNNENINAEEAQQPLHLYLSSTNPKSLEAARILAENLLDTICAECGASRISSCKVYSAVPPPPQLLTGGQSSEVSSVIANPVAGLPCTASGSMPSVPSFASNGSLLSSSNFCHSGSVLHPGGLTNCGTPQPNMVSYSYPSVTGGTCYSGYGGIYPQATPLQQVAQALRKAPAVASTTSAMDIAPKISASEIAETQKRPPQKRKFQELPVTLKGTMPNYQNLLQGSECLKPGSEDLDVRDLSSMPPPRKLLDSGCDGMPLLPPRTMPPPPPKFPAPKSPPQLRSDEMPPPPPRVMPPAPPKFPAPKSPPRTEKTLNPMIKKSNDEPVSDILLKLVEYGEEDDDIDAWDEESAKHNSTQRSSSKPFWAV